MILSSSFIEKIKGDKITRRLKENDDVIEELAHYLAEVTPTIYGEGEAKVNYSSERVRNSGWYDRDRGVQSVIPLIFYAGITQDGKGYCTDWEESSADVYEPSLSFKNSKVVKQVQEWLDSEANYSVEYILDDRNLTVEDLQSMDDDEWEELRDEIEQGELELYMSDIHLGMTLNIMENGNTLDCYIEIFDNGSGKKPYTVFEKSIKGNFNTLSLDELKDCVDMMINQIC